MIQLNEYDIKILKGISIGSGKPYRRACFDSRLQFQPSFIDALIEQGVEVIDLTNKKKEKETTVDLRSNENEENEDE